MLGRAFQNRVGIRKKQPHLTVPLRPTPAPLWGRGWQQWEIPMFPAVGPPIAEEVPADEFRAVV